MPKEGQPIRHNSNPIETNHPEITHIGKFEIKKATINGVKMNFGGVEHTQAFLMSNFAALKSLILNSSLVITETAPFDLDKKNKNQANPDAMAFFKGVTDIARMNPKKLAIIDPYVQSVKNAETWFEIASLTPLAGVATLALAKERFSRRELLASAAGIGIAYSFNTQSRLSVPDHVRYMTGGEEAVLKKYMTHGIDDTLGISSYNYRNIITACGIDEITKQHPKSGLPITVIHGAGHPSNIIASLKENTTEAFIKKKIYDCTYGFFGRQSIRNYEVVQGEWQLKSEQKI